MSITRQQAILIVNLIRFSTQSVDSTNRRDLENQILNSVVPPNRPTELVKIELSFSDANELLSLINSYKELMQEHNYYAGIQRAKLFEKIITEAIEIYNKDKRSS